MLIVLIGLALLGLAGFFVKNAALFAVRSGIEIAVRRRLGGEIQLGEIRFTRDGAKAEKLVLRLPEGTARADSGSAEVNFRALLRGEFRIPILDITGLTYVGKIPDFPEEEPEERAKPDVIGRIQFSGPQVALQTEQGGASWENLRGFLDDDLFEIHSETVRARAPEGQEFLVPSFALSLTRGDAPRLSVQTPNLKVSGEFTGEEKIADLSFEGRDLPQLFVSRSEKWSEEWLPLLSGPVSGKVSGPVNSVKIVGALSLHESSTTRILFQIEPAFPRGNFELFAGSKSIVRLEANDAGGKLSVSDQIGEGILEFGGELSWNPLEGTLTEGKVRSYPLNRLEAVAKGFYPKLQIPELLNTGVVTATLQGGFSGSSSASIRGPVTLSGVVLPHFGQSSLAGELSIAQADGRMNSNFRGELTALTNPFEGGIPVTVSYAGGEVQSSVRTPRGEVSGSFTGRFVGEHFIGEVDASAVALNLSKISPEIAGTLSAALQMTIPFADIPATSGALQISGLSGEFNRTKFALSGPARWVLNGKNLRFGDTRFSVAEHEILLSGRVGESWEGKLAGVWDLAPLGVAFPSLEQLAGEAVVDLDISGPLLRPIVKGPIQLRRGAISGRFRDGILGISAIDADGEFDGKNLLLHRIAGDMGDGEVRGSGALTELFSAEDRKATFTLKLSDIPIEPVNKLTLRTSGELRFTMDQGKRVEGELRFSEGIYANTISLQSLYTEFRTLLTGGDGGSFGSSSATSSTELRVVDTLDLKLSLEEPLLVDTNVFRSEIKGEVQVTGRDGELGVKGGLRLDGGEFAVGASPFEIVTGTLLFESDSFDPKVAILAESQVQGDIEAVRVRMMIDGSLGNPRVRFDSEGALSQQEIVTLLGNGQMGGRLALIRIDNEDERGLGELLNPLSTVPLEERLAGLTGFSSVEVGTGFSPITGESVPRLFAERPLWGRSRLTLESELGGQRGNIIGADYPIARDTTLNFGWRNAPTTRRPDSQSGTLDLGIRYRTTFPGTSLLPK